MGPNSSTIELGVWGSLSFFSEFAKGVASMNFPCRLPACEDKNQDIFRQNDSAIVDKKQFIHKHRTFRTTCLETMSMSSKGEKGQFSK